VSAVGNVQMFYNGTSVEADKVIYDQKTKRLHAEGNIRMTDAKADHLRQHHGLSDDYRDGFVDSLRVDTADATRMAATRADRSSGNYTVFENGVYTACAPCKDDPKKPPLWQVKGARIIHDQTDRMLYSRTRSLEFFGVPTAFQRHSRGRGLARNSHQEAGLRFTVGSGVEKIRRYAIGTPKNSNCAFSKYSILSVWS